MQNQSTYHTKNEDFKPVQRKSEPRGGILEDNRQSTIIQRKEAGSSTPQTISNPDKPVQLMFGGLASMISTGASYAGSALSTGASYAGSALATGATYAGSALASGASYAGSAAVSGVSTLASAAAAHPYVAAGLGAGAGVGYLYSLRQHQKGLFKGAYKGDTNESWAGASSAYGFLPGKSRHKRVVETVFENIGKRTHSDTRFKGQWKNKEANLEKSVLQDSGESTLDAKVRNDVFVANVMKDQEMMKEAVNFSLEICNLYGNNGARKGQINRNPAVMDHMWPDQDLSESRNSSHRGWGAMSRSIANHKVTPKAISGLGGDYLSNAIERNRPQLQKLAAHKGEYSLEQTMYILRVIGQLRDVMKSEKKPNGLVKNFLAAAGGVQKFNRINVRGNPAPAEKPGDRNFPAEHSSSRDGSSRIQPIGTIKHRNSNIYKVGDPKKGQPEKFDYLQGTSGTTIDMVNFFLAHGKSKDEATRLMQVFYANWHSVAPDGMAHSQSESIGTMMQYLHRSNLKKPIMTPIKSGGDVDSMKQSDHANALTDESPGYLHLKV
jgi:hypothetical protein